MSRVNKFPKAHRKPQRYSVYYHKRLIKKKKFTFVQLQAVIFNFIFCFCIFSFKKSFSARPFIFGSDTVPLRLDQHG